MLNDMDLQHQRFMAGQIIGYLKLLLFQLPNAGDRAVLYEGLGNIRLINQEVWLGCARGIANYDWPARDLNWGNYNPELRAAIEKLGEVLFPIEFSEFIQLSRLSSVLYRSAVVALPLLQSSEALQSTGYAQNSQSETTPYQVYEQHYQPAL